MSKRENREWKGENKKLGCYVILRDPNLQRLAVIKCDYRKQVSSWLLWREIFMGKRNNIAHRAQRMAVNIIAPPCHTTV